VGLTREQLIEAMERDASCCHAGSPRGISDYYCYIPVEDAADAIMTLIAQEEENATHTDH
jgi:hypothetical protein